MRWRFFLLFFSFMAFTSLVGAQVDIGQEDVDFRGVNIVAPEPTITAGVIIDTNATTACTGAQVLLGNGSCGVITGGGGGGGNFTPQQFQLAFNTNVSNGFVDYITSGEHKGIFNWTINTISSIYLQFNGNELTFDEGRFNSTINNLGDGKYLNLSGTNANQNINISPHQLNVYNLSVENEILFDDSGEHRLRLDATEEFGGITDHAFWFDHRDDPGIGEITFLVTSVKPNSPIDGVNIFTQIGRNNSASLLGNSWMVLPNNLTTNLTAYSNCFTVWETILGRQLRVACDSDETGTDFIVDDDIQLGGRLFVEDGIRSIGAVSYFLNGFDFDVFNGSSHFRTPRQELVGFEIGENATIFSKPFDDGSLAPFYNLTSDPISTRDWIVVASVNCFNDQCARSQGGAGSPIRAMETNISTFGFKDLTLNFSLTTLGLAGSDILNVTLNDNLGSGDFQIFFNTTPTSNAIISIPLTSNYENSSSITLRYSFQANVVTREAYVNEITLVGEATESSTVNVTRLDTNIKLGDGSQRIFWNDTTKVLELPGNTTAINVQQENLTILDSITLDGITIRNWNETARNIFDQELNITSNVTFNDLEVSNNLTVNNFALIENFITKGAGLIINWRSAGNSIVQNFTSDRFGIQGEDGNTTLRLFKDPDDFDHQVLRIANSENVDDAENKLFIVSHAFDGGASFFTRSLQVGGVDSFCSNLTSLVDCDTTNGGSDLLVENDIWNGGDSFFANGSVNISSGSINLSNTVFFNGSLDIQSFFHDPDGTGPWEVSGNTIFNSTTLGVGIGTAIPTHKLNVVGDINTTGSVFLGTNSERIFAINGFTIIDAASLIVLQVGSANKLIVTAGTMSPGANNAQTLGTSDLRWATVFGDTADFNGTTVNYFEGQVGIGKSQSFIMEKFEVWGGPVVFDGKGQDLNRSHDAALTISNGANTNQPTIWLEGVASKGGSGGATIGLNRNSAGSWEALVKYFNADIEQYRTGLDSDGTNRYVIQDPNFNNAITVEDKGDQFNVSIGGNLTIKDSITWEETGNVTRGPQVFLAYPLSNSVGFTTTPLNHSYSVVPIKDDYYNHTILGINNQIFFNVSGLYKIDVDSTIGVLSGTARAEGETYLLKNGAEITGTRCTTYNRIVGNGEDTCHISWIEWFDKGEMISVQSVRTVGTSTLQTRANRDRIRLELLRQ